jgi:SET domain-containing protein
MPQLEGLEVIRSKIHGYGLVTLRRFRRGELVMYGDGVLWREHEEFDDTYALVLPGYDADDPETAPPLYYDLADQSRWINHSCAPNTEVDASWDPATRTARAWWVAVRDIEIGEEILYDYAFIADLAEECYCGAERCRGVICDEEDLDKVPEKLRHLVRPAATVSPQAPAVAATGEHAPSEPLPERQTVVSLTR